jgi:hypothetical protein
MHTLRRPSIKHVALRHLPCSAHKMHALYRLCGPCAVGVGRYLPCQLPEVSGLLCLPLTVLCGSSVAAVQGRFLGRLTCGRLFGSVAVLSILLLLLLLQDILSRFHGAWELRPVRDAAGQVVACDALLTQDVLPRGGWVAGWVAGCCCCIVCRLKHYHKHCQRLGCMQTRRTCGVCPAAMHINTLN